MSCTMYNRSILYIGDCKYLLSFPEQSLRLFLPAVLQADIMYVVASWLIVVIWNLIARYFFVSLQKVVQ